MSQEGDDYICVTDIARYKDNERTDYIIQNWLRNRNTIEFLGICAYSSDREHSFHAMVNSAWRGQLETGVLRQVFTIRQGSAPALLGCGGFSGFGFPCIGYERRAV